MIEFLEKLIDSKIAGILIGGLLVMIGTLIADKRRNKWEERNFLREKLEDLYKSFELITDRFFDYSNKAMGAISNREYGLEWIKKNKVENLDPKDKKIDMMLALYFDSLKAPYEEYRKALKPVADCLLEDSPNAVKLKQALKVYLDGVKEFKSKISDHSIRL